MAATIIRLGDEEQVNTETASAQTYQSVTGLPDGGWLIAWTSDGQDGSSTGIFQQRYDKHGNPVWTAEQQVNVETTGYQLEPRVTLLSNGGWVVTWVSFLQDGDLGGIYQRHYDENGVAGAEQQVNTETTDHQAEQSVTLLADGGWVVTWTSVEQDGSYEGVYQQRYNANGTPRDGEQRVNTTTTDRQTKSSVTILADDGWIVTWSSLNQDGSGEGIYQQRYNADGSPRGGEQRVNTETAGDQTQPSVSPLRDGGWIVTWQSADQDGSGIYQQQYDASGNPVGGERQVNVYETGIQSQPRVAGLIDGGWLATWTSFGQDGSSTGIYQRRYMSVAEFGEGQEYGTGTEDADVFQIRNGGLGVGDSLAAGDGIDTLQMIEAGTLDLTAPDVLTGIEIVQGSDGADIIVVSQGRAAGITAFQGGEGTDTLRLSAAGTLDLTAPTVLSGIEIVQGSGGNDIVVADEARLGSIGEFHGGAGTDALHLKAGSYDLSDKLISGFDAIALTGAGSLNFDEKAMALLARSQTQNGTVTLTGDAFSLAERTQLYHQGIRKVTDAGGVHILEQARASLSVQAVTENTSPGTVVATLSATDPNPGDALRFELTDSAGGRFALSGNQLVVGSGSPLDYEQGASHRIAVRIVDEGGIVTDAAFTITIGDVPVEFLKGTSRADVLVGGSGRDVLYGGAGKDRLTGGGERDIFVFNTKANKKTNLDKITGFKVKDDGFWLDNKTFAKLGKKGTEKKPALLKKDFFTLGSKAKDQNDYLVYDKKKGVLYYDVDGSGAKKAVEIATLSKKLAMTYKDFFVI